MSKTTLFDSRIKKYAYREASQIYQDIEASPDGLSHEQVEAMREKYGANSFAERKNDSLYPGYYFVGDRRFSRLQLRQKCHYCHHYLFHDPN